MIAKGNPHNDGPYLARYLAADSKGVERAELAELRGFASDNIFDAFALGQLLAHGTKCENPFFHVQVRTPKGEELTRAQWDKVAVRIERRLGFDGQPRAMVFHQKQGHQHMHLVWSRIDTEDMRAIDPGLYKRKLKEVCRALEKEMGLRQVRNNRDPQELTQPAARPEYEQSRRLRTDLKAIREGIRDCWDHSDDGKSFAAALDDQGFILARGDERAFVIVDEMGGYHALSKRITGATAKETRDRLADLDPAKLPNVAEAKAMQRERRQRKGEGAKAMADPEATKKEEQTKEEERQKAIQKEEEDKQQAIKEAQEQKQQAIAAEEQRKQDAIKEAAQQQEERWREEFKKQADRLAEQAREMQEQERRLDAYKAEMARLAEHARQNEERQRRAQEDARAKEGAVRNAHSRYGQALAQHYDIKDPYGSLARSSMAEYGAFLRDRENLDRQIAQAKDSETRQTLELRKRIESAEYMAITSNRIANQSEIIVGRRDTEEAVKQRARAAEFLKEAQELRQQFRELQESRFLAKGERTDAGKRQASVPEKPREEEPAQKPPGPELRRDPAASKETGAPWLMVQERLPGKPAGKPVPLTDYVKTLPQEAKQPQRQVSPEELRRDPSARRAHYAGLLSEQQRGEALDHMREDIKAGRNLSASDVRRLNRDDLEKIKTKGDGHLREMIQEREKQRERERER